MPVYLTISSLKNMHTYISSKAFIVTDGEVEVQGVEARSGVQGLPLPHGQVSTFPLLSFLTLLFFKYFFKFLL
jgi:hypothetical protein